MRQRFSIFLIIFGFAVSSQGQSIDDLSKRALSISAISNRHVMVIGNEPPQKDQNILIVRLKPDDDDYETIANGKVVQIRGKSAAVAIDVLKLKKAPLKTDLAVLLGAPKIFKPKNDKGREGLLAPQIEPILPREPGYIWIQYSLPTSKLTSSSDNQANSFKNVDSLPRSGFELEWFLDFLSHYGFAFSMMNTKVPIKSYYQNSEDADVSSTTIELLYRTGKFKNNLRGILSFQAAMEDFKTTNPDEFVIASSSTLSSFGLALQWEPGDLLLKGDSSRFQFSFVRLRYLYGLTGSVKDGQLISRGTSATLSGSELQLTASGTAYLPWVPWVKRYTLSIESFQKETIAKFSGVTKSEGSFYVIPEGGTYKENEAGVMLSVGVRFDDLVGKVFKPKD